MLEATMPIDAALEDERYIRHTLILLPSPGVALIDKKSERQKSAIASSLLLWALIFRDPDYI
jgi:hypothetical protein